MSIERFFNKVRREAVADTGGTAQQGSASTSESAEGERAGVSDSVEADLRQEQLQSVEAGADLKHRKSGWNPEWLKEPLYQNWLYHTQHGMFCRLCRQHKPPVKKGPQERAFIEVGCKTYRKDFIQRHMTSDPHQHSVQKQATLASGLTVVQAFEPTIVLEHKAIIGGFKCLYWLIKNEIAHHTNYPKLLSLAQLLGCNYFEKLKLDQRTNYNSHRIVDEMLEILAKVVESPILAAIHSSRAIGLEVDETTDVSVCRQLDLHVRHLDNDGRVSCHFLDLVAVDDGKADSIVAAIKTVLQEKGLPTNKLYGLGTDGAAVMTGRVNGVAKQLTDSFPKLVSVACAAHRLALACKDASNSVPYMATFRDHLQEMHLFFRNSANRSATLRNAATTLGLSDLKVKEVKDTRWLSQDLAVKNLQRNLSAVLSALADEATTRKCPTAKGLYTFCATYRFVAALYLQADVLPHISCLSKVFQRANVNFMHIKTQVPVTLATLRSFQQVDETPLPGTHLDRLHSDLNDPAGLGAMNITHEEERIRRGRDLQGHSQEQMWARFVKDVLKPYLGSLESNLMARFQDLEVLGAFSVLNPNAVMNEEASNISNLEILIKKLIPGHEEDIKPEWYSYKHHLSGAFKEKSQAEIMQLLASENDEWAEIYPLLSQLAAAGLVIPVSSVNCERDFSTMNRVKTDLRNRLQGGHLAACLQISINGPAPHDFPYQEALELFFKKPRRIHCSNRLCNLCTS